MRTRDTNSEAIQTGHAQSTLAAVEEVQQAMGETSVFTGTDGGVATFRLGLSDVAEIIQPHIDHAIKH